VGSASPPGPSGPQGLAGPQGAAGVIGPEGPPGGVGPTGPQGPAGALGPRGPQGPDGFAAAGPQGSAGASGPFGPIGPIGNNGPQGSAGPTGPTGPRGPQGPQGASGPGGLQGPVGPQGATTTASNVTLTSVGVGTPAGPAGYILATNNITSNYSDLRLKENIKNIDNCIEKILSMTGVYFTQNKLAEKFGYKDYRRQIGLIAQQIHAVFPEAVSTAPFDADLNGNSKSGDNYLTINYDKLVPLLVEAIKEQQKEIKELLQKIG
jgi:hypothetical protein